MKKNVIKLISKICLVSLVIPLVLFNVAPSHAETQVEDKADVDFDNIIKRENTYDEYISKHDGAQRPSIEIEIPVADYVDTDMDVKVYEDFEGYEGKSIWTDEEGYITWEVDVPQEGLYSIYIEYFPVEGRSTDIEREIWINGESPFFDARHIVLSRVWTNAEPIKQDNRGNDLRPRQVESPIWQTAWFKDYMGYYNEPYLFYFQKGKNTVKLVSVKEPMVIGTIKLMQYPDIPTYKEYLEKCYEKGYKIVKTEPIYIQGESAVYKSDPTLYPINDRTSPNTVPYHRSKIRLNTIGGYNWRVPGQWIAWHVDVKEAGLYQIVIKGRQNITRGLYSNRKLLINGEVPFKEAENITFNYSSTWQNFVLGGEERPYLFYLKEGTNEIRMEVVLGDLAEILRIAEDSVYILNSAYRKIIMITGRSPDPYRDYELEKKLPEVIATFQDQSKVLAGLSERFVEYTGQRGSHNAILDRLSYQLEDMAKRPHTIQKRLQQFKDNVGALSTWILNTREQALEIDYIIVCQPDTKIPPAEASFIRRAAHEISAFFASFFEDYESVGDVYQESDEVLTVWVLSGRDQAQVIKRMIDDTFTPNTGIPVNVKLVQAQVLLPATVAGRGPDVALPVGNGEPLNYALRNAAVDLTQFEGFEEVIKEFHPSAILPYRFESGVYGLPDQQQFPMMFYRTDILEELGVDPPETWEDLYAILPDIQKNNMDVGVPVTVNNDPWGAMVTFSTLLYQRGGQLYNEGGISSALDTEEAIDAFKEWTNLYLNYKFPMEFDAANRFRTGEMPIVINEYWLYNVLQVFAPELRGLWEMAPIPGTRLADGSIDRSTTSGGYGVMMLSSAKDKQAAWEFMKWWVSSDTQTRYGRELESVMGSSARHPTGNMVAASKLPWPVKDYKSLEEQRNWVKGNPEVPGGYFTSRHLNNAFRKVVLNGADPRETLLDYVRVINEEIDNKRKEFGLKLRDEVK